MAENTLSLKIDADASDARQSVRAIAGDIDKLADSLGGELGARAKEAANQLRSLGQQESAIAAFLSLQSQVAQSEKALRQLTAQADAYTSQITRAGPPTAQEAAHMDKLRAAVHAASSTLAQQKTTLQDSVAHMQRHGIATQGAGQALQGVRERIQQTLQTTAQLDPRLARAAQGWQRMGDEAHKGGRRVKDAADGMRGSMHAVGQAAHHMAARMAAVFTVREAIQAAADMEKLQLGLQAVTGDAGKAKEQMDFVRQMASRTGVDVTAAAQSWLSLSAATKGTAVEGEATRAVFEAVSASMARAGKSSAETQNALTALAQMAGKGVVSMEEMRQQLGEALPGAFQAAARGMGITTQELISLIESGQLAVEDMFPALSKGLNELYGSAPAAQTLAQEITGIKNAFTDAMADIGAQGGNNALKFFAEAAQAAITTLGAGIVALGQKIGVTAAALTSLDFSGLKQAYADIEAEAQNKLGRAAQHNELLRDAINAVGTESARAAIAAQQQGNALQGSADQADTAGISYAALASAYADVNKEMAAQITLADKEVTAAKARGEAAIAEAKLKGDEIELRRTIGQAASEEADALQALANTHQSHLQSLQAELKNKTDLLSTQGEVSDARHKEIEQLRQLIAQKQLEVDRTRHQAAAARDNARAKGEEAQAATAAHEAIKAASTTRVADARASLALLQTQKSLAGQTEQLAQLMGDESAVRRARIEQLKIDIKITEAKAEVQRAEAEGAIAVAEANMAELRAKGDLTPVKEAELNATIKLAQAKLQEADAVAKSTRVTEQAIRNIRQYGDTTARAAGQSTRATGQMAEGWDKVATAAQGATQAAKEYAQTAPPAPGVRAVGSGGQFVNADGFASDAKGNAIGQTRHNWMSIYQLVKGMGVSDEAARRIAGQAYDEQGRYSGALQRSQKRSKWDVIDVTEAARRAAEKELRAAAAPGIAETPGRATGGGASSGGTHIVNVDLGGRRRRIQTTDADSQRQLQGLLTELANGQERAL